MANSFRMKNGMRVHLVPVSGTSATTVLVLTKVGSRYEYKKINGAAHFIEHMMFKGTKRRPSTLDISRQLDAVGAHFNAYTGKNITGYYIKAEASQTKLAIDVLHDMLFHSLYDKKEMDRERNVIREEIKMYEENPLMHIEDLLERTMYDGNNLGWEIAGTHHSMRTMPREEVMAFRDQYYVPSEMVVVVAGNIPEDTRARIERTFGKVKAAEKPPAYKPFGEFASSDVPRAKVQNKKTDQIQFALGFPGISITDERTPALDLLSIILGGTMSSRLFISVRERKGLAYLIKSSFTRYDDAGHFMIHAGLDRTRLPLATKTILSEIRKLKRSGVTPQELKDAKNHLKGGLLLGMESTSRQAEWYGRSDLFGLELLTPEEYIKKVKRVTAAQIQALAKEIFDEKKMCLAGIGPYKDADALRKAAGLE